MVSWHGFYHLCVPGPYRQVQRKLLHDKGDEDVSREIQFTQGVCDASACVSMAARHPAEYLKGVLTYQQREDFFCLYRDRQCQWYDTIPIKTVLVPISTTASHVLWIELSASVTY